MGSERRAQDLVISAALIGVVAAVYAPVRTFGFVSFDDPGYVIENARVLSGASLENVRWAFTTFHFANWHPLTWLSYFADVAVFGPDPGAMHLVNVALHAANAVLVFALLHLLTGQRWPSACVAALFAVHPLHVESVAWISQRKDVLSAFFGLCSLLAYARYARGGGAIAWGASAGALALGLMAKPMLVTLPLLMLVLDAWPLGRWSPLASGGARALGRLLREKIPFLLIAAASSALTLVAQARSHAIAGIEHVSFDARIANAGIAYAAYLSKLFWPAALAPLYPHPGDAVPRALGFAAWAAIAALTLLAFFAGRRRPAIAVGWTWFLVALVPVIGLVQVGDQAYADRYVYLPALGIYIALAWSLCGSASGSAARRAAAAAATAAVLALASVASVQVGHWRDSLTLFEHTLRVTSNNTVAHTHYANALFGAGRASDAVDHYRAADTIHPGLAWNHVGLGNAWLQMQQFAEARAAFSSALAADPTSVAAHVGLGNTQLAERDAPAALESFRRALELAPDSAEAHNSVGVALATMGDLEGALGHFEAALRLRPYYAQAAANLARAKQALAAGSAN